MANRNLAMRLCRLEAKRPGPNPVEEVINELTQSQLTALLLEVRAGLRGGQVTDVALKEAGMSCEAFEAALASVPADWFDRLSLAMASVERRE